MLSHIGVVWTVVMVWALGHDGTALYACAKWVWASISPYLCSVLKEALKDALALGMVALVSAAFRHFKRKKKGGGDTQS